MATLQSILDQQLDGIAPIKQSDWVRLKAAAKPLVKRLKKQAKLKTRVRDKSYKKRIRLCIIALKNAHNFINSAEAALARCELDPEDRAQIDQQISDTLGVNRGFSGVRLNILASRDYCSFLASMISGVTGVRESQERGRPANEYVYETSELIKFYKLATKMPVVYPKQYPKTKRGKNAKIKNNKTAHQYSTEFIKLRLQEIDPSITLDYAMTCIKNALKL
jgi:hypothetical protein